MFYCLYQLCLVGVLSPWFFRPLLILSPLSLHLVLYAVILSSFGLLLDSSFFTYFIVYIFFWPYIPSQGAVSAPFSTALFLLPHISVSLLHFTAGVTNILYNLQIVGIPGHHFNPAPLNFSTFRCTVNVI